MGSIRYRGVTKPAKRAGGLTERQDKFLDYYLDGPNDCRGNVTKSAIAAGYSPRSARQIGYEILTSQAVIDEMERRKGEARKRLETKVNDGITRLFQLIDNPDVNPQVTLAAIRDLLDRTGFAAVHRSEATIETHSRHTLDVTDRARAILAEKIRVENPETRAVIDVDGIPVEGETSDNDD